MKASACHIAAIHAGAKRAGLDEDTRRAFMLREVGMQSCKDMDDAQAMRVIMALRKLPGKCAGKRPRCATVTGRYAGILRAMWLNAWHLGVITNRDDRALLAFARRQTGADHTQFLTDGAEVARVIEGLKAKMARDAGVDWSVSAPSGKARTEAMQRRVLAAQRRRLGLAEGAEIPADRLNDEIARLGAQVRKARAK